MTPVYAEYNTHYKNFVVATKQDVRVYNSENGRLEKHHKGIIDLKQNPHTFITSFCFDDRHRKFYIGDTYGKNI